MERDHKYSTNSAEFRSLLGITIGLREAVTIIQDSRKTERLFADHK